MDRTQLAEIGVSHGIVLGMVIPPLSSFDIGTIRRSVPHPDGVGRLRPPHLPVELLLCVRLSGLIMVIVGDTPPRLSAVKDRLFNVTFWPFLTTYSIGTSSG